MRKLISVVCALALAGCATVFSGTTQEVSFQSQPDGANVIVGGKVIGKTPLTTMLKKEKNQTLVFEKEGYKSITMQLSTRINGWFWGNILGGLSGLLSSTTDATTGAVIEYTPNQYLVTFMPTETSAIAIQPDKRYKAKEYIVMSYSNLQTDIAKGKGSYLDSLYSTLEIPEAKRVEALEQIKAISTLNKDIPVFADKLIEQFIK